MVEVKARILASKNVFANAVQFAGEKHAKFVGGFFSFAVAEVGKFGYDPRVVPFDLPDALYRDENVARSRFRARASNCGRKIHARFARFYVTESHVEVGRCE